MHSIERHSSKCNKLTFSRSSRSHVDVDVDVS